MTIRLNGKNAKQIFESLIVFPGLPDEKIITVKELQALLSISMSLKRVADVLTGAEIPLSLFFPVEDLAYRAGQSFKRGKGSA